MSSGRDEQILQLIERLTTEIKLARNLSLTHTALLLKMAKLDLRTIAHAISDEELHVFASLIEEALATQDSAAKAG